MVRQVEVLLRATINNKEEIFYLIDGEPYQEVIDMRSYECKVKLIKSESFLNLLESLSDVAYYNKKYINYIDNKYCYIYN